MVREITSHLMPLNTPEVLSGGRLRQSPDAGALKPLSASDFIPGAKVKDVSEHDQLTEQAQKWVGQTFYGTLLKQMHDSPFKSQLFDGGRGGQAFQPLMDQHLIDRMAKSHQNQKLVRGIVRQIEGRQAYRKQTNSQDEKQKAPPEVPTSRELPFNRRLRVAPGLRA